MIKSRAVLAASLLAFAGAASAEVAITPTITTDYDFRGISQTNNTGAVQMGLTYTGEGGVYMGVWGSNVNLPDYAEVNARSEVDTYVGFAGGDAKQGYGYDVGAIYYSYPNHGTLNYPEVYLGMSKGFFSAKLWYSWNFNSSGDTAYYADVNLNMPSGEVFSVLVHVGYSGGQYWTTSKKKVVNSLRGYGEYMDWAIGFGAKVKEANFTIKYVDGSDLNVRRPHNLGRVVLAVSTTLSTD